MEKEAFDIWEETYDVPGIPAILYGKPSPNLLIYIHGEHETEFNEEELAEAAEKDGFQFLSVTMEDVQNHVIWNGPRFPWVGAAHTVFCPDIVDCPVQSCLQIWTS